MDEAALPAVQKAHDLNRWLLRWAARVPRAYKFTLGDRVQTTAIDLYLALVEASHLRSKERALYRANRLLDQVRLLLRRAHHAWFPGNDLPTPLARPKGLPIGNLSSQLWANTHLSDFDHWVKQGLGRIA